MLFSDVLKFTATYKPVQNVCNNIIDKDKDAML